MQVGFIGLGIMGQPMAGHLRPPAMSSSLRDSTHGAGGTARQGRDGLRYRQGGRREAEVVIIMVPDTPDVEAYCSARTASPRALSAARSSST